MLFRSGFITINPVGLGGAQNYGSSFLPASYQGTRVDLEAGGILDIRNRHLGKERQRSQIDLIQDMNRGLLDKHPGQMELEGVIQSFELAYRMQTSVPSVLNLESEKKSTLDQYGINDERSEERRVGKECGQMCRSRC